MRIVFIFFIMALSLSNSSSADAAAPAASGLQVTKPIYAWKTETDIDKKTGQFNHCLVKNMYDNGTIVMLAENAEGVQRLALHFPQEKMQPNQHFDLTLQVDKRDIFPVEAIAVSPVILTIGIPQALPDQMRKGQALYVRGPNDEVVYTLDGADGAVLALRDCISTSKFKKPTQIAQDGTPPAPLKNEAQPVDKKAAAVSAPALSTPSALPDALQKVFTAAGMTPRSLIGGSDSAHGKKLDYAWFEGDMLIGAKRDKHVPGATLSRSATYFLKLMKERCQGSFVAEASPVTQTPVLDWQAVEAACSTGEKDDTIAALLFANDAAHLTIYVVEAPAGKGSKAIKARDAVLKALRTP